ncbi:MULTISPECIES: YafY family protein [Rhodococcus]|uniref:YafY family protein n=1 Tax=Rhodococcus oxybenzonivorans TaxID=1990687 RepID=A0AAE4UXL3_9NOCA|nr:MULTISPECIES: YafY family protein [Rhodococcus]MDV7242135.1 YafY family protein [Rhodococcus oxybenzonivorans]MDV7264602.1 YafY family protein [Rhodococcus oxybenzonivorans]MDV7276370.1 YafY family protein [Rhodococcus oxybenzonivorans]MDV7331623.1 YafY family protein [Rhodococcus oxybenzonivorans]MDV7343845.1 YafY family protein [Rhodococcus oxybenzonivorans]
MSNRLSSRLSRLLNLVPYFIANPGMSAAEAAAELGVTTTQLMTDLNQLWVCGLPGYGPGDLIDLSFSEESIEVTFSAGIDRPLRLTSTEATALLIALRSLVEMPGMVDPSAAHSAIAKIEDAAGTAAARTPATVSPGRETAEDVEEDPIAATVRAALHHRRALDLTYYSASRDRVSERTVDPVRIVLVDNHSYLQAWCRQAEGVRLFRLDRIDAATELEEPSTPPAQALVRDSNLELFSGDPSLPHARLHISAECVWVLDYYPMDVLAVGADGAVEASMSYGALEWMARLLLGFGGGITVLEPVELVEEVRRRAVEALAAYEAVDV